MVLFYPLCQRFGSRSPEDSCVQGEIATVHLKSHRRFSTKADSSTLHNSYSCRTKVCFHHVQYKTMDTLPLADSWALVITLLHYKCLPKELIFCFCLWRNPLSLNIPPKHHLTLLAVLPLLWFSLPCLSCKWMWKIAVSWTSAFFHCKKKWPFFNFSFLLFCFKPRSSFFPLPKPFNHATLFTFVSFFPSIVPNTYREKCWSLNSLVACSQIFSVSPERCD